MFLTLIGWVHEMYEKKLPAMRVEEKDVIQNNHLSDYNGVVQATVNKKGKMIVMAKKAYSLAHTKWMCKYHIVFISKYRRKIIYNQYRKDLGEILRTLCRYKGVEIIEGHLMNDYARMLVMIPPKYAVYYITVFSFINSAFLIIFSFSSIIYIYNHFDTC